MEVSKKLRTAIRRFLSFFAIIFGIMTIKYGGFALFGGAEGERFAGNYISFVLWFNFVAGFFYIVAGLGLLLRKEWSATLIKLIAALSLLVFIAFGIYISTGVEYEIRTVGAMFIRLFFWMGLLFYSRRQDFQKGVSI